MGCVPPPPGELVRVLEIDDFAPPMDTFHGPHVLVARIFDYPPDAVRPLLPRLERIAQRIVVEIGAEDSKTTAAVFA